MTRHNATWSEEQYYGDDRIIPDEETIDPRSDDHGKGGYWDYRDEE